jgi:hypothetical protein
MVVAQKLKLTAQQVRLAIEQAVQAGKSTAKDIFNQAIKILTGQISCEKIFGATACNNIKSAMDKFHEQRALLKEAIMSVALKNLANTAEFLLGVKEFIISRIKNFQCSTVLPAEICTKLSKIAQRLKILPGKLHEAIEIAIFSGAQTAQAIYKGAIEFLTAMIKCDNILTPKACQNLLNAAKKLHEQAQLIKGAIMEAALKQITDAKQILKTVRDKLIEKAKNFNCTDVLPKEQCQLLMQIANRFKIRAQNVTKILITAVVKGAGTAQNIYQLTIGAFIEQAKNLKCEDIITDPNVCKLLDAFAANFKISAQQVTMAVKQAIIAGKQKINEIIIFVKKIIVDEKSCIDFFPGYITARIICKGLRTAAWIKGITFDVVIAKLRNLVASGVSNYLQLKQKVLDFIVGLATSKRSIEASDSISIKDEFIDMVMTIIGGIMKVTGKMTESIKNELKKKYDNGLLRLSTLRQVVKDIVAKFNPLGDELYDDQQDMITDLKEKIKKFKEMAKEQVNSLLAKLRAEYERLMKIIPNDGPVNDYISDIEDLALQSLDEGIEDAIRSF